VPSKKKKHWCATWNKTMALAYFSASYFQLKHAFSLGLLV